MVKKKYILIGVAVFVFILGLFVFKPKSFEKKFMNPGNRELYVFIDEVDEIFKYLDNYQIDTSKDVRFA